MISSPSPRIRALGIAAALALLATPASANLAANPSFEAGPAPGMAMTIPVGSLALDGWRVTRNAIEYCESRWDAAEGLRSIALNGSAPGGIEQTIATLPNSTYTVTFYMGGDAFSSPVLKHLRATAAGQSQDYEFDASHAWPWGMGWLQKTFAFTATSSATTIEFYSLDNDSTGPTLDHVSVTGPSAGVPTAQSGFALAAPHPNPARRDLNVRFEVPAESPLRVTVLDVAGREVAVIAEGIHAAGPHVRVWNGRGPAGRAPGGLYFIRLAAPGVAILRKVVLAP